MRKKYMSMMRGYMRKRIQLSFSFGKSCISRSLETRERKELSPLYTQSDALDGRKGKAWRGRGKGEVGRPVGARLCHVQFFTRLNRLITHKSASSKMVLFPCQIQRCT